MLIKKGFAFLLMLCLLMSIIPTSLTVNAAGPDRVTNGDFETDADGDWKADCWDVSSEIEPYVWLDGSGDKVLKIQSPGSVTSCTISQGITGDDGGYLPDGYYNLALSVQGNTEKLDAFSLFVNGTESGNSNTMDILESITGSMTEVVFQNIKVTGGACTIGISLTVKGSEWDWVCNIDDVSFYKTGEINYAANSGFETDVEGDWKVDGWTVSEVIDPYVWLSESDGNKVLSVKASGSRTSGTITQVATGEGGANLPDGVYALEIGILGDNSLIHELKLTANGQTGSNLKDSIASDAMGVFRLDNIEVNCGSCTIGITFEIAEASEWGWVFDLDNVVFYKTGPLSGPEPTVTSLEPETVYTSVGQAPVLPATVTAHLSNGSTRAVPVTWSPVDAGMYSGAEKVGSSFEISGTVAGTELTATAIVHVTYKSFDMNGDTVVDIRDLAFASARYLMTSSDTGWDDAARADVNDDGIVNIADLQAIAAGIIQ